VDWIKKRREMAERKMEVKCVQKGEKGLTEFLAKEREKLVLGLPRITRLRARGREGKAVATSRNITRPVSHLHLDRARCEIRGNVCKERDVQEKTRRASKGGT